MSRCKSHIHHHAFKILMVKSAFIPFQWRHPFRFYRKRAFSQDPSLHIDIRTIEKHRKTKISRITQVLH